MSSFKVFDEKSIQSLLDLPAVIRSVESAYKAKAENQAEVWPMIYRKLGQDADMDIRSGWMKNKKFFGCKILQWSGNNVTRKLPAVHAVLTIMDSETGEVKGILNASALTGYRTGAAGAVGSKFLANPDSQTLLIIGTGNEAPYQIMGQICVMPCLKNIIVVNPRHPEHAAIFVNEIKEKLKMLFVSTIRKTYPEMAGHMQQLIDGVKFIAKSDIQDAVSQADIIVTVTPSAAALIQADWVKPGTHINAMGADMPGKQELDENLYKTAVAVADDREQSAVSGETQVAVQKNILRKECIAEIGDILIGKAEGRTGNQDITIFDSTGLALQDLETAALVIERSSNTESGILVKL